MRRTTVALIASLLAVAGCGGGTSTTDSAAPDSSSTSSTSTTSATTTTESADDEVGGLDPYDGTVGEFLDLASTTFSVLPEPPDLGSGMPSEDVDGAFGGRVASTASVYVLGESLDDQARGAVVVIDVANGTIPTQLVAFAMTTLEIADPDYAGGSSSGDLFASRVVPELGSITETVQRFSLDETTLQLTVRDRNTLEFAFVKSGEEVPEFVTGLAGP